MSRPLPFALALAAAALSLETAAAATSTSTYADLCRTPDSDDVAGHEIRITWTRDGPQVSFSWTDGQVRGPVAATQVRYSKARSTVGFVAATPDGEATFQGRLEPSGLSGELKDGWEQKGRTVHLPRVHDSKLRACAPAPPG